MKVAEERKGSASRGVKRKPGRHSAKRGRGKGRNNATFQSYNYRKTFVLQPIKLKDEHNPQRTRPLKPKDLPPSPAPVQSKALPEASENAPAPFSPTDVCDKVKEERTISIFAFTDITDDPEPPKSEPLKAKRVAPKSTEPRTLCAEERLCKLVEAFDNESDGRFSSFNKDAALQIRTVAAGILETQRIVSATQVVEEQLETKRVRFCPYDLSAIEAPNISIPGSEQAALQVLRILCQVRVSTSFKAILKTHQQLLRLWRRYSNYNTFVKESK